MNVGANAVIDIGLIIPGEPSSAFRAAVSLAAGTLQSFDPETGRVQRTFYSTPPAGTPDSQNGGATGGQMWMTVCLLPITYALDGRQYVILGGGSALYAFALPERHD
jgi:hypothetical protein